LTDPAPFGSIDSSGNPPSKAIKIKYLYCETDDERKSWIDALNQVIRKYRPADLFLEFDETNDKIKMNLDV
jgi:hypothetical protein